LTSIEPPCGTSNRDKLVHCCAKTIVKESEEEEEEEEEEEGRLS